MTKLEGPHPDYFEDFEIGMKWSIGTYEVTEEEIIEFATKYDPQYFHLDDAAAKKSLFGGLCASGWHTAAMMMRLTVDHMVNAEGGLGSPGINELRWVKPVRPGDKLRMDLEVEELHPSKSRPEIGRVHFDHKVYNQNDELVMTFKPMVMIRCRPQ
ncbi:MAG: MaoC family dehydratase [Sphingomonadales bacterium]|nr:MaoC family dehydratase [Sphingomonadales bacterium]